MSKAEQSAAMREVFTSLGIDPSTLDAETKRVIWESMIRLFRASGWRPPSEGAAPPAQQQRSGDASAVFPPYGRSKGAPVAGASMQDLEYYAAGCRRTLGDPAKSRWHEKERVLLAAIEAEIARADHG